MDPTSAGIMAGGSLVGGLLTSSAQAEEARRQRVVQALQEEMKAKQAAARQLQQGTQQAIGTITSGISSL